MVESIIELYPQNCLPNHEDNQEQLDLGSSGLIADQIHTGWGAGEPQEKKSCNGLRTSTSWILSSY